MSNTADSNVSKSDLEQICMGLGISPEGVKADLIQRIKNFARKGKGKNSDPMYIDEMTHENEIASIPSDEAPEIMETDQQLKTLRELAQRSKQKTRVTSPLISQQNSEGLMGSQTWNDETIQELQGESQKRKVREDEENPESIEGKVLSEFKKLENAMLGLNERLNTVTIQVQDAQHKVQANEAWPKHKFERFRDQHEYDSLRNIGKELDFALESRNIENVSHHIDRARELAASRMFTLRVAEGYGWDIASALPNTQDHWMKGKDELIEKAKTLVDAKKSKHRD